MEWFLLGIAAELKLILVLLWGIAAKKGLFGPEHLKPHFLDSFTASPKDKHSKKGHPNAYTH